MNKYVFVSERDDDRNDGLDESRPVRIKISIKTGREVRMVDNLEFEGQRKAPNKSEAAAPGAWNTQ